MYVNLEICYIILFKKILDGGSSMIHGTSSFSVFLYDLE